MKVDKDEINNLCKQNQFLGWTGMSVMEDKHVSDTME